MSKKSSSTIIGAFVIVGVILIAVSVALFGGSEYFAKREKFSVYFDEDTKGLRVGSNVLLNGVRIGYVSEISLLMDKTTFNAMSRVTIEILPDTFIVTEGGKILGTAAGEGIEHERLIEQAGLRAQLEMESIVTGQLVVNLTLKPETAYIMRGIESLYPEIPSLTSEAQVFLTELRNWLLGVAEHLDVEQVSQRLNSILKGLDELSNSQDLRQTLSGVNQLINDDNTQQLTASMQTTLEKLNIAVTDASQMLRNADGKITTLGSELRPAIAQISSLLGEAEQTLVAARKQLRGETVQVYQLEATLNELESASRAVREFFDYLERNPEALITGKSQ